MDNKQQCRELLLEIVDVGVEIRADFALPGLGKLGIDASDTSGAIACLPEAMMLSVLS